MISSIFQVHSCLEMALRMRGTMRVTPRGGLSRARFRERSGNDAAEEFVRSLAFDSTGLVTAIAQDVDTGAVQMQAYANEDAVRHTIHSGNATFFSRSRGARWVKGESSGHTIRVLSIHVDCDSDSLIYLGMLPPATAVHHPLQAAFARLVVVTYERMLILQVSPLGHLAIPTAPLATSPSSTRLNLAPSVPPLPKLALPKAHSQRFSALSTSLVRPLQPHSSQKQLPESMPGILLCPYTDQRQHEQNGSDSKPSWTKRLLSNDELLCKKARSNLPKLGSICFNETILFTMLYTFAGKRRGR